MDDATKNRLRPILANGKRGRPNTEADDAFAVECWRKWPDEYAALRSEVVGQVIREINPFYDGHSGNSLK